MDPQAVLTLTKQSAGQRALGIVSHHFEFFSQPLSNLHKDRKFAFSLKGVFPVEENGQNLVRVDFTYKQEIFGKIVPVSAWMLLDPEHYWCQREAAGQGRSPDGMKEEVRFVQEMEPGSMGFPVLKRAWSKWERKTAAGHVEFAREATVEYDLQEVADLPDRDFTLTVFGLPEPEGVVWDTGPRYYLWLGGTAVFLLLGGLGFRHLAARRKALAHANAQQTR